MFEIGWPPMRLRWHRVRLLFVVIMCAGSMILVTPLTGQAHSGCGPTSVHSRWYAAGLKQTTNYGGFYESHEQNYVVQNAGVGGWVVNRLLVGARDTSAWLEVGYGWGWRGSNIPHFYIGRMDNNGNYNDWKLSKSAPNPANINSWHNYLIETTSSSSTGWTVKIDWTTWGTFATSAVAKPSNWIEVGGESNQSGSTMHITSVKSHQYRGADALWRGWGTGSSTKCFEDPWFHHEWLTVGNNARFWGP